MLSVDWDSKAGWHKPQIIPYGPLSIDTTATVLHYGISVYEGIGTFRNSKTGNPQAYKGVEHV
jgi:branched-chain amino acid aminotransferase